MRERTETVCLWSAKTTKKRGGLLRRVPFAVPNGYQAASTSRARFSAWALNISMMSPEVTGRVSVVGTEPPELLGAVSTFFAAARAWQAPTVMSSRLLFANSASWRSHLIAFPCVTLSICASGGPLMWVHAVHHRQHNPCRQDSSYIHPIEVALGLGLCAGTIFGLSRVMGDFHVVTIILTWVAFSQINLHNHDLWETDRFPFRYLATMSRMHHNHHARFTGGNFATITLLYDWMFGTLDQGQGYGRKAKSPKEATQN